jgi:hypothetical protein
LLDGLPGPPGERVNGEFTQKSSSSDGESSAHEEVRDMRRGVPDEEKAPPGRRPDDENEPVPPLTSLLNETLLPSLPLLPPLPLLSPLAALLSLPVLPDRWCRRPGGT